MSDSRTFVDTNVFVYALYVAMEQHAVARKVIQSAHSGSRLCISPQVIAEFFTTVTHPRRVAVPRDPSQASDDILAILAIPNITVLPMSGQTVSLLVDLARRYPLRGPQIYDLQIAATMLCNGVRRIITFNSTDFEPFEELSVVTP